MEPSTIQSQWHIWKYSQLSRKRPPLVHDIKWFLTKGKKINPNVKPKTELINYSVTT